MLSSTALGSAIECIRLPSQETYSSAFQFVKKGYPVSSEKSL